MKVYFIGIGGIGVSALARYYLYQGWEVLGSDLVSSEITEALKKSGAKIFIYEQTGQNFPQDVDLVIYSQAVPKNNQEFLKAKQLLKLKNSKFKILSYPEALGQLTQKYKTIAVAGSHGKTTTTALLALIMVESGLDPNVIVGTNLKEFGNSNFRPGKSEYLLIEADEWQASFLNYNPWMIVLTNIDQEHLDCYEDLQNIIKTFSKFLSRISPDGSLVINEDDQNSLLAFSKANLRTKNLNFMTYSLKTKEANLVAKVLQIPGSHNLSNALAAFKASKLLGIDEEIALRAISKYQGAWRRLQTENLEIGGKKITLITDYAHHPTEIEATLKAIAQKYRSRNIWAIIQPHQYARFLYLFDEFLKVCQKGLCHRLTLTDVYFVEGRDTKGLRQKVLKERSPQKLIEILTTKYHIQNTIFEYQPFSVQNLANLIEQKCFKDDVIVLMGAGDIHQVFLLLASKKV